MKMKNVCHVRHVLTDDNSGSTHDIIFRIPLQNPLVIYPMHYDVVDSSYCDGATQLNKSFVLARESAMAIRNACVYPLVNFWFAPSPRFINAHCRRANVNQKFSVRFNGFVFVPKWTVRMPATHDTNANSRVRQTEIVSFFV